MHAKSESELRAAGKRKLWQTQPLALHRISPPPPPPPPCTAHYSFYPDLRHITCNRLHSRIYAWAAVKVTAICCCCGSSSVFLCRVAKLNFCLWLSICNCNWPREKCKLHNTGRPSGVWRSKLRQIVIVVPPSSGLALSYALPPPLPTFSWCFAVFTAHVSNISGASEPVQGDHTQQMPYAL